MIPINSNFYCPATFSGVYIIRYVQFSVIIYQIKKYPLPEKEFQYFPDAYEHLPYLIFT